MGAAGWQRLGKMVLQAVVRHTVAGMQKHCFLTLTHKDTGQLRAMQRSAGLLPPQTHQFFTASTVMFTESAPRARAAAAAGESSPPPAPCVGRGSGERVQVGPPQ